MAGLSYSTALRYLRLIIQSYSLGGANCTRTDDLTLVCMSLSHIVFLFCFVTRPFYV